MAKVCFFKKSKWASLQEISCDKCGNSLFSWSFDKSRKLEIKIKALNKCCYCDWKKKTLSMSFAILKFPIGSSTSTNKVGSLTSFSSEDNVSNLSAKNEAFCEW